MSGSRREYCLVLVTVPNRRVGRRLAGEMIEGRVAACVNLVPGIESHYVWQGRRERASECLLLIKTTRARLKALEEVVHRNHPYETPEFVVISLRSGSARYLKWIEECTG